NNDSDADGDLLTITQINGTPIVVGGSVPVTGGSITLNGNGTLTFTPNADYFGSLTFTYTIGDGRLRVTATVIGTVNSVNDGPVALGDSFTTNDALHDALPILNNDSDADGDPLTITHINGSPIVVGGSVPVTGGSVTLNGNGTLTYTPNTDYFGSPTFTYT